MTAFQLEGRTIVVTGAGQGLGAAGVKMLVDAGARVIATDLPAEKPPALAEIDTDAPGSGTLRYHRLDVTDPAGWTELVGSIPADEKVHGLVNNAGVTAGSRPLDASAAELQSVFEVNVAGGLQGIRAVSPLMGTGGSIVNIGSVAGLTAHIGVAYTASKWAVRGMAKAAALDLAPRGIRVNTVHPGFIETPMTAHAPAPFRDGCIAEIPLGRTGTADEVAAVVTFLLSPLSSFVTGAEIAADGGQSGHGGAKSISDALRG